MIVLRKASKTSWTLANDFQYPRIPDSNIQYPRARYSSIPHDIVPYCALPYLTVQVPYNSLTLRYRTWPQLTAPYTTVQYQTIHDSTLQDLTIIQCITAPYWAVLYDTLQQYLTFPCFTSSYLIFRYCCALPHLFHLFLKSESPGEPPRFDWILKKGHHQSPTSSW